MSQYTRAVVIVVVGLSWTGIAGAVRAEEAVLAGTVKLDGYKAEVRIQDVLDEQDGERNWHIAVTLRFIKPTDAPRIRTDRLKIWLLRDHFRGGNPGLRLIGSPEGKELPERKVEKGNEVKAAYTFSGSGLRREHMFAVVIAVDDVPTVVKLPRATK